MEEIKIVVNDLLPSRTMIISPDLYEVFEKLKVKKQSETEKSWEENHDGLH
jgi:hypothetical protein